MAAYGLAREFRKRDQGTPLLIVARDGAGAYTKPMLSNALALGKAPAQLLQQDAARMAAQLDARLLPHTEVTGIDTGAHTVTTSAGRFAYSKLVLATGASPLRLHLAGDGAHDVLSVNSLDDYALLRARLAGLGRPARVAILGAGLIGCEFADDLLAAGHAVDLVDPNPRLLSALAAPSLSAGLAQSWAGRPVTLHLGTVAQGVARTGPGLAVALADGSSVAADVVLSAVGLRPNTALARDAGIATARGIVVDRFGRTSAPDVYALGDCAEYATDTGGSVLPYVAPLLAAARAIAATLAGTPTEIRLGADPVVVKTPSYKLALLPPPQGMAGGWSDHPDGARMVARFVDAAGVMRGFGLSHPTPALRAALLAALGQPA
jgi:rubredoxin-NAD+ reductase